jgi:hypothetical protein
MEKNIMEKQPEAQPLTGVHSGGGPSARFLA